MNDTTLEALYTEYAPKVRGYVRSRIRSEQDAEDIVSNVFVKVAENMARYDPERASWSTWIYTITQNTVRDHYRRYRGPMEPIDDLPLADDTVIDAHLLSEDTLQELAKGLAQLPERERDILVLRFYNELTPREVAQRMGISYANVRYLQSIALKKLRGLLNASDILG